MGVMVRDWSGTTNNERERRTILERSVCVCLSVFVCRAGSLAQT